MVAFPVRVLGISAGGTLDTSNAMLRFLKRQVAVHERDHPVHARVKGILAQLRQIDIGGAALEQRLLTAPMLWLTKSIVRPWLLETSFIFPTHFFWNSTSPTAR